MNNGKKILIVLWGYTYTYSLPGSSRALYIFNELKRYFPDTYIIMQRFEGEASGLDNLIQINPIIPIKGKFQLLKGIIFRYQITISTLLFVISKKIDFVILRGDDTILVHPFLKLLGIKTFYDFHGLTCRELNQQNKRSRAFFVRRIENVTLRLSNKIIVVSNGIKMQIQEYQNKCLYLPNGVDIDKIKNANCECTLEFPSDIKIIGFIGNWEQVMKIDDICESIKYLDNAIALIIGKGYKADDLFKRYKDNKKIIFTGKIEQNTAYTLLKKIDICIIPYDVDFYMSKIKHFFSNRKVTEYLVAGKPIVLAKILGIPSYLCENENCLLYESGNPKDLADKITILLSDDNLYKRMSENNKRLAEQFTWERLIKQSGLIEYIYEK